MLAVEKAMGWSLVGGYDVKKKVGVSGGKARELAW